MGTPYIVTCTADHLVATAQTELTIMANVHAVDLALLIFRCAIGAVFIAHGVNHIFGGGKIEGTGRWFESLGMKPGIVHAWVASITEIGAGGLLVLGLLTAFGGAGVVGVMLVAWITNHLKNGFFIFRPGEGWEYVMVLTVSGLLLATVGPGEWSIDNAAGLTNLWGWKGLLIAVVAGVGGTALLLLTSWRPEAKPSE